MARLDAGKLDLALEPVSLDEVVREVASLMQPQAEQFDVAVDVAGDEGSVRARRPAAACGSRSRTWSRTRSSTTAVGPGADAR